MNKILSAVTLGLAFLVSTAQADVVTEKGVLVRGAFEYVPNVTGSVKSGSSKFDGISIGAMRGTFTSASDTASGFEGDSFLMYCVDLFSAAGTKGVGYVYDKVDYVTGLNPYSKIGSLITFNHGLRNNSASDSAAMQLAIWELLYDVNPGSLTGGNFKIGNGGVNGTDVISKANTLLAGAASTHNMYNVSLLSDNDYPKKDKSSRQDFITAAFNSGLGDTPTTPVPEPETYALMLAGLGAMAFVSRRRKQ